MVFSYPKQIWQRGWQVSWHQYQNMSGSIIVLVLTGQPAVDVLKLALQSGLFPQEEARPAVVKEKVFSIF
jgi:hypothetical protein